MIKLNFGSGGRILEGYINIDIDKDQGANFIWDLNIFPYPFPDNYADKIKCICVLEHLEQPSKVIKEFHRIIKPNGIIKLTVPHFSSNLALYGEFHKIAFPIEYFYQYKENDKNLFNQDYNKTNDWDLKLVKWLNVSIKIEFIKGKMKYINYIIEKIVNINKFTQMIYEIYFSGLYRANYINIEYKGK